jgi:hypothetical protein
LPRIEWLSHTIVLARQSGTFDSRFGRSILYLSPEDEPNTPIGQTNQLNTTRISAEGAKGT